MIHSTATERAHVATVFKTRWFLEWLGMRRVTGRRFGNAPDVLFGDRGVWVLRALGIIPALMWIARFWDILLPRTRAAFTGIRAGNRIFFREAVVVKRAAGVRKFIIMTPDAPPEFAADLRTRASRAKQLSDLRQ